MSKNGNEFLHTGTCLLDNVHNAFKKALKELDFDIDQFLVDIPSSFKMSSVRREDYAALEVVTNLLAKYALKHFSTRWVMKKTALCLLE